MTGAHYRNVVDTPRRVREEIGYLDASAAVLPKGAFAAEQTSIRSDKLIFGVAEPFGARLAVELDEEWLGIEGFQMAGAAGHEQEDHGFRLRLRQMRRFGRQRIGCGG